MYVILINLSVFQWYESRYRCLNHADLLANGCDPNHIYVNQPQLNILSAIPLKDHTYNNESDASSQAAVQIYPQNLRLQLVKGIPVFKIFILILQEYFYFRFYTKFLLSVSSSS